MADIEQLDSDKQDVYCKELIESIQKLILHKIVLLSSEKEAIPMIATSLSYVIGHFVHSSIIDKYPEERKKLLNIIFHSSNKMLDSFSDMDNKNAH